MSDTPTPQELARSLKAAWSNHALHHLSDETVVQIAAALERLARVEQERDASDDVLGAVALGAALARFFEDQLVKISPVANQKTGGET